MIVSQSGKQIGDEGCLSVRGKFGTVERPLKITVVAYDRHGNKFTVKAQDFLARVFCHEYDHLDGVLYVDKAKSVEEEKK